MKSYETHLNRNISAVIFERHKPGRILGSRDLPSQEICSSMAESREGFTEQRFCDETSSGFDLYCQIKYNQASEWRMYTYTMSVTVFLTT